jgi:murein DD-endopeptidase MepM/ murein hydrolase activator NlpD
MAAILAQGDDFMRLLQRAGVSGNDAARAGELVADTMPLGQIAPGTRVDIVLGPRPAPGEARSLLSANFRPKLDLQLAVNRQGDGLVLSRQTIAVDETPLRIRGIVGPSLYRSARAAGAPVSAIQQYLQALDGNVGIEAMQPGDAFDMVISYKRAAGGEAEAGQVLYAGLDRGTTPVAELMRWGSSGEFYSSDALSKPVTETHAMGGLLQPVFGRITSMFGMRRHPILGYTRMHAGVDFGAAWGSPIRATADGVVSYAGWHGGHGQYVRLDHGGGLGTGYGHMSRIAVSSGTRVSAGQVIGFVGSSGLSTGPHLHYEMYRGGQVVNPLGTSFASVTTTVRQVDPKQVAEFKAKLARFKAIRPGIAQGGIAMAPSSRVALR